MSVATSWRLLVADAPVTPSHIGRYRIDGVIARGASGVVYRALDEGSGEPLALKTLRVVDETELESLRREAQLLARLEHPGIVSVRDTGVDRGVPWYAMELIEGGTMSDVLSEKPPLDRTLLLIARLCEPLAFLHGEGIVHRDLKPQNVVVRDGDWPVIVDFGLISHFEGASGREALQAGGELIGTVVYMSPEQAAADFVDARSDLYSLGCILYEAVTGEPPFDGDVLAVLQQHISAAPRRPSQLRPDLPPALDDLILRLLAKAPRDRPGYADDVARILYQLNGIPDAPFGTVRRYLYRPSFIGREEPAREIADALQRAGRGEGSFIAVSGESGVGKTRLAMEAARLAKSRRFDVITAQCSILDLSSRGTSEGPLAPLRPLLRAVADRCFTEGRATADRILGRRAKVLAAYEPALSQIPGFHEQPDAPRLPPEADRDRTLAGIVDTIARYMDGGSLLLVVDDMQWADDLTLSVLAVLRDGLIHRLPLVILGVYRTEEAHPALDRVVVSPSVRLLEIARLSSRGVESIVSDMLAIDEPPWALVRLLARESEGNPFFVGEFLRGAVEAELLRRSPLGEWYFEETDHTRDLIRAGLPISSSLRDVIARRLDTLDDASRRIVEAGSVIGREFPLHLAAALAGVPETQQIDAAGRLLRRQILESAAGDHVRFAHDKLREVAYGGIAASRKVALHRLAAEALEAAADDDARAKLSAALAHHWLVAGDKRRAIDYFGLAGRRALQAGAYADAHLHLVSALGLDDETGGLAGGTLRSHWRRMLAIASFGVGDLDASIRHGSDAMIGLGERVPRTTRGWAGVAIIEMLRRFLAPQAGPAGSGDAARPDPEAADSVAEAARASAQLATSHFYRTDVIATVANLLCSLNRSERAGIDSLVVESSGRVAYVAGASGLHTIANRYFDRAEAIGRRGGTPRELGMSLYLRAQYVTGQGEWRRAQELAREAIEVLDDIGDRSEAEIARAIAAHSYFYSSKFTEADTLLKEILSSARDRAHEQHVAWAQFLLGRTQLALGRSIDAVPLLSEGRAILVRVHDLLSVCMCEGLLTIALLRAGERERAEEIARCLLSRMERGRAAVPHAIDGYAGLLEYLFEVSMIPESSGARADLVRVHRYLRSHARIFPLSLPLLYRTRGWKQWTAGNRSRAVRSWRTAAVAAAELDMPHERARCYEQLARYSPDAGEAERSSSIASAIRAELNAGAAAAAFSTAGS